MFPCADIKVIELGSYIAAPAAGALLADMGAQVIKVEPPGGDPLRNMMPSAMGFDGSFDVVNRGKHSVTLDLYDTEDKARLIQLISEADVFVCSLLHSKQKKYGLDSNSLLEINPVLVHASLTGYGSSGPDADTPGFDTTAFFSRSGLSDRLRDSADMPPPWPAPAQGDYTAGMSMAMGILGALLLRSREQKGQVVETSLLETAIWTQSLDYGPRLIDRQPVSRTSRYQVASPTTNRYCCGDGKWLTITMPMRGAWKKLCVALNKPEWLEDSRFNTPSLRHQNMQMLIKLIDEALATNSLDYWAKQFDANGIVWAPLLTQLDVLACPQVAALDMFPTLEHPEGHEYQTVRPPFTIRNSGMGPRRCSPSAGEHNEFYFTEGV